MYSAPSGPMVIAVGNEKPLAITVWRPDGSICTTRPVPSSAGPGKPGAVIDSSAYSFESLWCYTASNGPDGVVYDWYPVCLSRLRWKATAGTIMK